MFGLRFWGVRGSYPVPGEKTLCYGGNTSCVEVFAGNARAIFDAGTGIIHLGKHLVREAEGNPIIANIFFSHTHRDHTEGIPFFDPAYIASTTMNVFGPTSFSHDLHETLAYAMLPPFFPVTLEEMKSTKLIKDIMPGDKVLIDSISNTSTAFSNGAPLPDGWERNLLIRSYHAKTHPGAGIYIYSAEYEEKKIVYATDTEGCEEGDANLIEFTRSADVLIHDTQYLDEEYRNPDAPKKGWGHSTVNMAIDVARKAGVKRLVLFHHDPEASDDRVALKEQIARGMFPGSIAAYEGLEMIIDGKTGVDF